MFMTLCLSLLLPMRTACMWVLFIVCVLLAASAAMAQTALGSGIPQMPLTVPDAGPVRLRQVAPATPARDAQAERTQDLAAVLPQQPPYVPGEFERFVRGQLGGDQEIRRLGAELIAGSDGSTADFSPLVPADYIVAPGDEVLLLLWGGVDADLRLTVDRSGRIHVPRVGAVQVAGVRHADLPAVVQRRVAQVFRNFESSVTLGQLRGIRVFVTGFVTRPGSYTVTSLSTVVSALMRAGGPSAAGSFRTIELRRGAEVVAQLDLYDLLLQGNRAADRVVQAGDVVHVGPVGTQVAIIGSVNKPAVVELKPGETVSSVLRMAGGFTAVADRGRLAVERLNMRNAGRVAELELPRDETATLSNGDLLRAFSAVAAVLPTQGQSKRVRVEGEVFRPGEYVLTGNSSVRDAIRTAGGVAPGAFLFATEFTRVSVQRSQQENYERALRDLETDLARASPRVSNSEEAAVQDARSTSATRLIERLRALRPSGRVVLNLEPDAIDLPDLALEDGDRILIPARPTTVGVVGSVFNAANYLYRPGRTLEQYLQLAGGPTKGADEGSVFVVRANGNVISERQGSGWFTRRAALSELRAEPGDTVFVPEEMNKLTFLQAAKDWTQVLYQFGLGIAGTRAALR